MEKNLLNSTSKMITKNQIWKIIITFVIWRTALFVLSLSGDFFFLYDPSFPYSQDLLAQFNLPRWIYSWANFDGVHYLTIVTKGYVGTGLIQAFFPGFPLFVKVAVVFFRNPIITGLIISNIFFFLSLILVFILIKLISDKKIAWLSVAILLLFPTSFFLVSFYSESIFLFFVLASFIAVRKKRFAVAGLLAGLASATRLVGIFLVIGLIFRQVLLFYKNESYSFYRKIISIIFLSFGFLGLSSYMLFLGIKFSDPFFFLHVQEEFGGGRQETLVFFPQVVYRYIKIGLGIKNFNLFVLSYFQELVAGVLGLAAVLSSWIFLQRKNIDIFIFSFGAFLLPTLTGTFSSMPRYILVSISIFLVIAKLLQKAPKWVLVAYFCFSSLLLIINTILFVQGYWVA